MRALIPVPSLIRRIAVVCLALACGCRSTAPPEPALPTEPGPPAAPAAESRVGQPLSGWLQDDFDGPAKPGEHLWIIGGGSQPTDNQRSLAVNVDRLRRQIVAAPLRPASSVTSFADGHDPRPDLQSLDESLMSEPLDALLADILGPDHDSRQVYQDNGLPRVDTSTTRKALAEQVSSWRDSLRPSDSLLIYVTGHGASGGKKTPRDTGIWLWQRDVWRVTQFTKELDAFGPEQPIVCVMVQCFSGGFADMIFSGGEAKNGLSPNTRVGFFAATHDRMAAGCTPSIDTASYAEYSTYFWPALFADPDVPDADYDGDGRVSYREAHAAVIIQSDTIDVPTKTTDRLLSEYSAYDRKRILRLGKQRKIPKARLADCLALEDLTLDDLRELAEPEEQAILNALWRRLALPEEGPAQAQIEANQKALIEQNRPIVLDLRKRSHALHQLAAEIRFEIYHSWPALRSPWSPQANRLLATDRGAIWQTIQDEPRFQLARYQEDVTAMDKLDAKKEAISLLWAKALRLQRLCQQIVARHNLPSLVDTEVSATYERLRAAESDSWLLP